MELVAVKPENRQLLWNINQKYLYEMTNYYGDEMDREGNLHYGYFDAYFTEPKRKAFFLYEQGALVGFVMIHPYSDIGGEPDYVMAEFTVFPIYCRRHLHRKSDNRRDRYARRGRSHRDADGGEGRQPPDLWPLTH